MSGRVAAIATLAGVGTPEQTYGVACTVFPGNKRDMHGTPWLDKPRRRVSPVNASVALDLNAKCYNYTTKLGESVSNIVEWFDVDYRDFIQHNRKQFGDLQDVMYRLGQTKKARQLQRILEVVSSVTKDLTQDQPYFTCTFYDKSGAASNVTCYSGNTQKCAENGTVSCALHYKDVNVTRVLRAGGCVRVLGHQQPQQASASHHIVVVETLSSCIDTKDSCTCKLTAASTDSSAQSLVHHVHR